MLFNLIMLAVPVVFLCASAIRRVGGHQRDHVLHRMIGEGHDVPERLRERQRAARANTV